MNRTAVLHTSTTSPMAALWPDGAQRLADAIPLPCWIHAVDSGEELAANAAAEELTCSQSGPRRSPAVGELRVTVLEIDGRRVEMSVAAEAPRAHGECEAHMRALVDGSVDIIYEADHAGRFTFVSAASKSMLGFSPRSLLGRPYTDLIRPDWRNRTAEHYRTQRLSAEPSTHFEFPAVTADGRTVWLAQNVQTVLEGNRVVGFRAVARDITRQRVVEERFHAFMDHSPTAAFIKDAEGRYVYANAQMNSLFASVGQSVVGRTDADLLPAEIAATIGEHDRNALATGKAVQVIEEVPVDGIVRQWLVYKFPIDEDGKTSCLGGVAIDLTDRLQLERDLAAARDAALGSAREKSQFLANMSHEIRTPMNGVLGLLGILLDTPLTADQHDLAQTARSSADALLSIINDILDFSKIEAGKLTFEDLDLDIRAACDSVIDLLAESARAKSLEIGCVIDPRIPRLLRGDPGRLRQVLLNLVGNAVKFTSDGGVLIQVEREEERGGRVSLRFRVTDTGAGVPHAVRPHLFEPFTQAEASTTRRFGGTGLGLAISRQLVRMMEGEIGCESEPGCGSTFWFTASFECNESHEAVVPHGFEASRVLIVEDSTVTRHLLAMQLTAWHIANETAVNGVSALSMLRNAAAAGSPFDVVITDLQMPQIDGVTLARLIAANPDLGKPRVIVVTSGSASFDASALAASGITRCLRKPVKPQHLLAALSGETHDAQRLPPPIALSIAPSLPVHHRVLVVDDNVINQKVAVRQLQKLGIAADAVGNGIEALEAVGRIAYDLVLMDCQMPEMDGYAATAQIRAREAVSGTRMPIIALTASASDADRKRCLEAGMDDFVSKPVREEALRNTLALWLEPETAKEPRTALAV
ncbi:MAG: response regulator [Thermoanaerobaculia bacterium]